MGIMDELSAIDKELKDKLEQRRIEAEKEEIDKINAENERKENEKKARKERKTEEIQRILEDTEEGLDEPHIYMIEYSYPDHGGFPGSPLIRAGTDSCEVLMSEREKRIAQLTGHYLKERAISRCGFCTGIISVTPTSRELSEEEKMEIEAAKQKVSIIKTNKETENDCVLDLYDDEFHRLQIHTSLRNALLSSISIKNGRVLTSEQQKGQNESKLPAKAESKISFKTLKNAIKKVLGRGER